ncbi:MAG: alpha/beta fold hydrolase [Myxococcales bacterium]|nr:alpha/beta fold hydrolase [Myxococcales bacterium]
MILHGRVVEQTVDTGRRAAFVKELLVTSGRAPLSIVRKRSADPHRAGGTLGPVLLVHGFAQNRYAWHLPSRSFANALAVAGFDVYNLDLRGHGRSRQLSKARATSLDDYIAEDLPRAVEEVQRASGGGQRIFYVGHSLGGLVGYAGAPDLTGALAGLVSIGSPYHFTRGSKSLQALALLVRGLSVVRMRPHRMPLAVSSLGSVLRTLRPVAETALYPIVRGWHPGALEPEVLAEHLSLAFDRAIVGELVEMLEWANERRFGGRATDRADRFEALDLPLLVLAGKHDDLAPPESVKPGFERSRSPDKTYRTVEAGHIDLLVGREASRGVWSIVTRWLTDRTRTAA